MSEYKNFKTEKVKVGCGRSLCVCWVPTCLLYGESSGIFHDTQASNLHSGLSPQDQKTEACWRHLCVQTRQWKKGRGHCSLQSERILLEEKIELASYHSRFSSGKDTYQSSRHRSYQCGRGVNRAWVTALEMSLREGDVATTLKSSMHLHGVQLQIPIVKIMGQRQIDLGKQFNRCMYSL